MFDLFVLLGFFQSQYGPVNREDVSADDLHCQ